MKVRARVGRRARQVTARVVLILIAAIAVAVAGTIGGVPGLVDTEGDVKIVVGVLLLAVTASLGRLSCLVIRDESSSGANESRSSS
jgi:hypothetical protein